MSRAVRARFPGDIQQSGLIAESARMAPLDYSEFILRFGSGACGRGTANKIWMAVKFFLLCALLPLKTKNHSLGQKNCKKI
jgi:hypothetical protein